MIQICMRPGTKMNGTRSATNSKMLGIAISTERAPVNDKMVHMVAAAKRWEEAERFHTTLIMTRYAMRERSSMARLSAQCSRYASSQPIILTTLVPSMISRVTPTVTSAASSMARLCFPIIMAMHIDTMKTTIMTPRPAAAGPPPASAKSMIVPPTSSTAQTTALGSIRANSAMPTRSFPKSTCSYPSEVAPGRSVQALSEMSCIADEMIRRSARSPA